MGMLLLNAHIPVGKRRDEQPCMQYKLYVKPTRADFRGDPHESSNYVTLFFSFGLWRLLE